VFPYALSAAEIARHFSYTSKTDRLLVPEGFAAILPWDADCAGAAGLPASSLLEWESPDITLEALRTADVLANMDSVAVMEEGAYQLCYTKSPAGTSAADSVWLPSGIRVMVQSEVLGLSVNGVRHRAGLINYMPLQLSSVIQIVRNSSWAHLYQPGEALAILPHSEFCDRIIPGGGAGAASGGGMECSAIAGAVELVSSGERESCPRASFFSGWKRVSVGVVVAWVRAREGGVREILLISRFC